MEQVLLLTGCVNHEVKLKNDRTYLQYAQTHTGGSGAEGLFNFG